MITVFNPTREDFVCRYDGIELPPAKAMDFTKYSDDIGDHVKKHLINFVVNKRGIKHTDEEGIKKVIEEVSNA